LKKGQEIEAVITNIDVDNRRLSLSIKDTEPSAWEKFTSEHRPGDIVRGKITRFANYGAFVELAEGLEGLCHVSELSDERVERPEDAAQIGQEMDFRILRIEPESKKIGLSHLAGSGSATLISRQPKSKIKNPKSKIGKPLAARTFRPCYGFAISAKLQSGSCTQTHRPVWNSGGGFRRRGGDNMTKAELVEDV